MPGSGPFPKVSGRRGARHEEGAAEIVIGAGDEGQDDAADVLAQWDKDMQRERREASQHQQGGGEGGAANSSLASPAAAAGARRRSNGACAVNE